MVSIIGIRTLVCVLHMAHIVWLVRAMHLLHAVNMLCRHGMQSRHVYLLHTIYIARTHIRHIVCRALSMARYAMCLWVLSWLVLSCGDVTSTSMPTDSIEDDIHPPAEPIQNMQLGHESSCYMRNGDIFCWGAGTVGQLGDSYASDRSFTRMLDFDNDTAFVSFAMGHSHGCGIIFNGALVCWGRGSSAALGLDSLQNEYSPRTVAPLNGIMNKVQHISSGLYHSCASTVDNMLYCWGYSGNGQVGNGLVNEDSTPTILKPAHITVGLHDNDISSLAAGGYHSCATYADGRASCWGYNAHGQLGNACIFSANNDSTCSQDYSTPVDIPYFDISSADKAAASIAVGEYHSCAISSIGNLFCFGKGLNGQLGNNAQNSYSIPQYIGNLPAPVVALTLGNSHSCVVLSTGEAYCFGDNAYGQLGNSSHANSLVPVRVNFSDYGHPAMVGIAAGGNHTCSWDSIGEYYCWGSNSKGQLGIGVSGGTRATPVRGVQ